MRGESTSSPSQDEIDQICKGLSHFNQSQFQNVDRISFGYFIKDDDRKIMGGLIGYRFFSSLHVKYLWLSESIRGQGYGSKLLLQIEQDAREYDIANIFLDTYTFQAPKFYESHGYLEVGRYKNFPLVGVDKIFYQKQIVRI